MEEWAEEHMRNENQFLIYYGERSLDFLQQN